MYFRFRPSKTKWIGDVLTHRYNAVNYLQRSFFWSTFVCCVMRRFYIDATMPLAPLGKAQQYCSVFNFQLVFRGLFLQLSALCLRTRTDSLRQFCKTMPIHFALLGRKRKYVKSKTTAKLREKRTSIAAVRAKLGQFDIIQTPHTFWLPTTFKTTEPDWTLDQWESRNFWPIADFADESSTFSYLKMTREET